VWTDVYLADLLLPDCRVEVAEVDGAVGGRRLVQDRLIVSTARLEGGAGGWSEKRGDWGKKRIKGQA